MTIIAIAWFILKVFAAIGLLLLGFTIMSCFGFGAVQIVRAILKKPPILPIA